MNRSFFTRLRQALQAILRIDIEEGLMIVKYWINILTMHCHFTIKVSFSLRWTSLVVTGRPCGPACTRLSLGGPGVGPWPEREGERLYFDQSGNYELGSRMAAAQQTVLTTTHYIQDKKYQICFSQLITDRILTLLPGSKWHKIWQIMQENYEICFTKIASRDAVLTIQLERGVLTIISLVQSNFDNKLE